MLKAASTKNLILTKSLELIHKNGYQSTSIDEIIATTNVTKGAFFYHFKSKEQMGLAIVNEIFYPKIVEGIVKPLASTTNVIDLIYKAFHSILLDNSILNFAYGCPVVNLIEEMSPINEPFRKALGRLLFAVKEALELALVKAQSQGEIRKEVDCKQVATFILTGYAGVRNVGKLLGEESYKHFLIELKTYLNNLK